MNESLMKMPGDIVHTQKNGGLWCDNPSAAIIKKQFPSMLAKMKLAALMMIIIIIIMMIEITLFTICQMFFLCYKTKANKYQLTS